MKYYLKLGFILLVTCAIATGILASLNKKTAPIIANMKVAEAKAARLEVMVDDNLKASDLVFDKAELGKDKYGNPVEYFIVKANNEVVGYAFTAGKRGYSSVVKSVVGLNKDFEIKKIKIVDQAETPGLGANCVQEWFHDQFINKTFTDLIVDKDGGIIKSLTGATITTRAITNSINEMIQKIHQQQKGAVAEKSAQCGSADCDGSGTCQACTGEHNHDNSQLKGGK